jgi:hypothetical protein
MPGVLERGGPGFGGTPRSAGTRMTEAGLEFTIDFLL